MTRTCARDVPQAFALSSADAERETPGDSPLMRASLRNREAPDPFAATGWAAPSVHRVNNVFTG